VIVLAAAALGVVAAALPAGAFPPPFYSAKDIRATVVNEETGDPLADVVVVALWELRQISGQPRLHVAEAVTDARGNFHIPGWGPKPRPALAELAHRSPLLLLFKSGFVPLRLHNEARARVERFVPNYRTMPTKQLREMIAWYHGSPEDALQDCIWDGLTLQMEPFRGTPERWLGYLQGIKHTVTRDDVPATVKLHKALLAEQRRFVEASPAMPLRPQASDFFFEIGERLREATK
jgi:hypothetical protein